MGGAMADRLIVKVETPAGELVAVILCDPTTFSTGSTGFRGQQKATIDGARYQLQLQAVKVGSKPKGAEQ